MSSSDGFGVWVAILVIFLVLGMGLQAGCGSLVSEDRGQRLLEKHGFANVKYTGRDVFFVGLRGCSEDDIAILHYDATNSRDQRVQMDVCGGILKGATIRE